MAKVYANLPTKHGFRSHPEQPVFVPIGEFLQDAEQRGQLGVWSIVRLIPLDLCPHWIANSSEVLSTNNGIIKIRFAGGNGELKFPFIAGAYRRRFVASYRIHEMIQAATEGIETITNSQRPIIERRRLIDVNSDCVSGALSIHLLNDAVRISLTPGNTFITNGLSMFRAAS
jgi:hypothetical protein